MCLGDLILEDRSRIIFVEVKSRLSAKYGLPQEAITYHKKRQIIRVAKWYLQKKGCLWKGRFDLMSWQSGFMVLENRSLNIYPGRST